MNLNVQSTKSISFFSYCIQVPSEGKEGNPDIKPRRSEPREDIKPRRSEPREDIKPRRSEPREDIKPRRSEPREDIKPRRSEPREDIKPRRSEPREDIKGSDHKQNTQNPPRVAEKDSVHPRNVERRPERREGERRPERQENHRRPERQEGQRHPERRDDQRHPERREETFENAHKRRQQDELTKSKSFTNNGTDLSCQNRRPLTSESRTKSTESQDYASREPLNRSEGEFQNGEGRHSSDRRPFGGQATADYNSGPRDPYGSNHRDPHSGSRTADSREPYSGPRDGQANNDDRQRSPMNDRPPPSQRR